MKITTINQFRNELNKKTNITFSMLEQNLKTDWFYCAIQDGFFGSKETIEEVLKLFNLKITTIDYVKMEIKYEQINTNISCSK